MNSNAAGEGPALSDGLGIAPEALWRPGVNLRTATCRTCLSTIRGPEPGKPLLVPVMGFWICGVVMGPMHSSGWSGGFGGFPQRVRDITWAEACAIGRTPVEAYENWCSEWARRQTYTCA